MSDEGLKRELEDVLEDVLELCIAYGSDIGALKRVCAR